MSIATEITRITNAKAALKTAINAKGGTLTDELIGSYAAAVAALPSGTDVSDTTAVASDVASGKYFYSSAGVRTAGTAEFGPFDLYKVTSLSPLQGVKATAYSSGTWTFDSTAVSLTQGTATPVPGYVYAATGTTLIGDAIGWPIPADGLVFYAPLHSSQSYAQTGQALTEEGDVTFETVGNVSAFSNDGSGNYITFPDTVFPSGSSARTISMLAQSYDIDSWYRLFWYGTKQDSRGCMVNIASDFSVEYYSNECHSDGINSDTWYHVLATYSGGTTAIYVDGTMDNSTDELSPNTVLNSGCIGRMPGENSYLNGAVCELKVWNRAITQAEITAEYNRLQALIGA